MLKWLAIVVCLFVVAATADGLPRDWGNKQEHTQTHKSNAEPASYLGIPFVEIDRNGDQQQEPSKSQPHDWHYWEEAFWPANWANWALFLAAIWAGCLALKTVRAIQLQAAAQMDSERAWLTAEVANFEEPAPKSNMIWIEVPIMNYGKTPALIKRITAIPALIDVPPRSIANTPGKLPPYPDYSSDSERTMNLSGFDLIIAPNQTHRDTHVFIWPLEWEEVKSKYKTLYVYGLIEYMDTVKGERHETGFCRIYAIPEPNYNEPTGFMFSPFIPDTYFRAT